MSKAILILDKIPKNCDNCPILDYCYTDKLDLSIRQPFCPLKEIPDCVLDVVNGIKNDYVTTKEV